MDELVVKGRRWAQAAVKLRELADDVDRRQAEAKELAGRARKLEVAMGVKPLWLKRDKIDSQLEQYQHLRPLEEGTLGALDDLNKRIEEHERQRDVLKGQRQQLRDAQWGRPDERVAALSGDAYEPELEVDLFSLLTAFQAVVARAKLRPKVLLPPLKAVQKLPLKRRPRLPRLLAKKANPPKPVLRLARVRPKRLRRRGIRSPSRWCTAW